MKERRRCIKLALACLSSSHSSFSKQSIEHQTKALIRRHAEQARKKNLSQSVSRRFHSKRKFSFSPFACALSCNLKLNDFVIFSSRASQIFSVSRNSKRYISATRLTRLLRLTPNKCDAERIMQFYGALHPHKLLFLIFCMRTITVNELVH